ncbi:MAG: 1-(5-phosphoribosyl)-5-[(5-phosphoribosylamino)methylideneamino]imidazole-4-carboxamide isomerase [Chloroflexi bacterium]|nr:1-(5-phosphoribosyl)-5-[(5-phosphoribosylamino)methylideneamino]imidazole-4-carboxamide isomerase [Chloroflexota bacterium]
MYVIPAIDIKDGKCVRLFQGDYDQVTVYSADPVGVALEWQKQAAVMLHVVDLDGAAVGTVSNLTVVQRICENVRIPIELGGGMRDLRAIEEVLVLGVERVILGTVAVENPRLVEDACRRWGERVVVGIDARDGLVATRGWKETSQVQALDLARQMLKLGARRFIYTDISRDGTLTEPNYGAIRDFVDAVAVPVVASGGVASVEHIARLRATGAEAVIVGKALYTGGVDLGRANDLARGWDKC